MLMLAASLIAAILVVFAILCYLKRFWYFQDIKGLAAGYPLPLVMDALWFRSAEKLVELAFFLTDKVSPTFRGFKFSVGFDSGVILFREEDISFVMNSQGLMTKGREYRFTKQWLGDGLLVSRGKKWVQRRKLLTPTFHFSILRTFIPTFEAIGDVLIDLLNEKANGSSTEVSTMMSLYTLDVITETSLGTSIDAQRNENQEYIVAIKKMVDLLIVRGICWWKRFDFLYQFTMESKKYSSLCEWIHNYTFNIIDQRKQALTDFDDELIDSNGVRKKVAFLDMLIKSTVDGKPLSNEDIREEVDTFMFEGHDTSSSTLSFSLYCLSHNPEIQEKLFNEQNNILGEEAGAMHATYDDLQKMDYLEMVIKEVLRLYPAVGGFIRSVDENISMDFGTLRKGLQIMLVPFITHRNPEYFPDPDKFDPERFSVKNINKIKPFTYIPFSGGYRNCIGQRFAMLSLKSGISKIVRNFKIHPDLTFKPILCADIILKSKNGIRVIFEKRN